MHARDIKGVLAKRKRCGVPLTFGEVSRAPAETRSPEQIKETLENLRRDFCSKPNTTKQELNIGNK